MAQIPIIQFYTSFPPSPDDDFESKALSRWEDDGGVVLSEDPKPASPPPRDPPGGLPPSK